MSGVGKGYGKVILFNEHFVVYGIPAVAAAIGDTTVARVEDSEGFELIDNRPETPGYKKEKREQQKDSLKRIFEAMDIAVEKNPVKIVLEGDLIAASGLGASAASCVAIARALSDHFNLNLDDDQINRVAYEGEKGYHGNPSGIDNTAATYGGVIWFQRKPDGNVIERIKLREPVEIVIGNTGRVADTKKAVAGVRERKEKYPDKYNQIFKEARKLVFDARSALEDFDIQRVGDLMNKNHRLLQEIEVSSEELDRLVEIALEDGAFGAKLTGGGLGGNMIALTPGKDLQEKVAVAMEKEGFQVIRTTLGG
ncbi:MAG TPA: mevalonate kinase [Thermoplasmatales archaeon]|nr:mevalonate kinase [Thermoplasmatales archaeon]